MAGKSKTPFKEAASKRVTAIIKQMNALAQMGPRCEDPEHAVKVTAAISGALDRVAKNWKTKSAAPKEVFTL